MSGRPGRSGGHNKLSLAQHALRGTRPRHGSKPTLTLAATPRHEPIPAAVEAGLHGPGLEFVRETWSTYSGWTPPSIALLHEAGVLLEQLQTIRGKPTERATQKVLLSVIAAMKLED